LDNYSTIPNLCTWVHVGSQTNGAMKVKVDMRSIYGTYFTQVKEFKDDRHLENWLRWMDSNQDRVKVIGTSEVNKVNT
jgi:hypothetical protein